MKFSEDADLGAQQLGNNWNGNVIDSTAFVAFQAIDVGKMHGGDENDRSFLKSRVLANHFGQFEAVEFGHADIHQQDREVHLQQQLKRFSAGRCFHQIFAEFAEHHLV